jgi:hypothetical protein
MPTPDLGYGNQTEASVDAVNIWMRGQPWYQAQLRAWGQDPGHPTLTKSQSQQILRQAQAQGVVVDEGDMEVDDHGNFNPVGHKLRNTLIVGGLAAATIATMGAAGAFSGAAGAGSGAAAGGAGAAGTGGTLASTAIGSGYLPAIAGAVPTGMAGGLATGAGTFGAGMGAAATTGGIINSAKSIVDTVNKAKGLVTGLTGSGGSSNGTPSGTPTIADLAAIVAAIGKGRADGRVTEADVNQNQARAEADIFRTRMEAALKGPSMEARSAAIGDTLANVKPFAWTGGTSMVGNIPVPLSNDGGLTPANYGPATRRAGQTLANLSADRVNDPAFALPAPPTVAPLPQSGKTDSIINTASTIGSLFGAVPGAGGSIVNAAKGIAGLIPRGSEDTNLMGGKTTINGGLPSYDPTEADPNTGLPYPPMGYPSDPSDGTGRGPGMSGYVPPDEDEDPLDAFDRWLRSEHQDTDWPGNGG